MLALFSIPEGSKAEMGKMTDRFADRILEEGKLSAEGRYDKNGHYHNLGEDLMEQAILALNNPSMIIADK